MPHPLVGRRLRHAELRRDLVDRPAGRAQPHGLGAVVVPGSRSTGPFGWGNTAQQRVGAVTADAEPGPDLGDGELFLDAQTTRLGGERLGHLRNLERTYDRDRPVGLVEQRLAGWGG
ncbi:hypothetical protein AB0H28_09660 [Micromonospora sp. NPDC050980]|uniref:hypothetical protein n=1 Tax=Micromonospora sp. NPDC050980 TaxID=3155161 RepID=UPI0033FF15B0